MVPPAGRLLDLAPVLEIRAVDLLAIAGGEIPAEFMPTVPDLDRPIESLIRYGLRTSEAAAARDFARSLPRTSIRGGPTGLPTLETVTFGAVFRRLLKVRNLSHEGMACATGSSISTVAMAMGNGRLPSPERLELLAAILCIRPDDLEAMAARPAEGPPPSASARKTVPWLWTIGELILAVAPLEVEQFNAVVAFAAEQVSKRREPHWSTP
ncbi:helix-turn-helix domain-containing protein [Dactylosporangium siamense]|uniref:helix-turn-helix domain-containing protein n=1 Tax=Dactylosporangium siamense TaxID=685454 RepID=UPI00194107F5|nr:helix-turn-helix transcriptional regulator [Dactylosporangium siamense]